ncbi:MAG: VWA domain-containing protein [Phycisphaeraceae bacterium]|nr:VWA domain-containing protein [Phycisphaeraceae bacterium]
MTSPEFANPRWTPPLHFEEPMWLVLLALAIPIAWTGLRWLSTMSPARRVSAVLARCALLLLVVLALSGASVVGKSDRLAVVFAVDVSGSVVSRSEDPGVAVASIRAAIERLDRSRGPDDLLGVVLFDGRAAALATPTLGKIGERSWDLLPTDGTGIESAIRLAGAIIPPDADGRVVLVTDGHQTVGDALAAAADLGARSIPVDVVAIAPPTGGETFVERVDVPPRAAAGGTVAARIHLYSTEGSRGTLRVLLNGQAVGIDADGSGSRVIETPRGRSIHLVEFPLGEGRVHSVQAIFEPDRSETGELVGDSILVNNIGRAEILSPGTGEILIVDGVGNADPASAGYALVGPLARSGLGVRVVVPEALPTDLIGFEPFDLVILQNVPASAVAEESQRALVSYVRDLGGGLAMIGGHASFGAGGWKGSELEPILPVLLDLPDRIVVPEVAIVFVLDSSGSMRRPVLGSSRTQQQVANESVAVAIRSLDRTDLVGVVRFSNNAEVVVPLGPNSDPDLSVGRVLGIRPDGGTDARAGLIAAAQELRGVEAKVKHVVLLSDGRSIRAEDLPPMAAGLAAEGVKVTTIAVGDDADVQTMRAMADLGEGVFHNVINPTRLPRVFLKIIEVVRSPMVREGRFSPRVLATGSPIVQDLPSPPDLFGYVMTRAKEDPLVTLAMVAPEGEPLLAHWPVDLGRVLAFTSDAHDWASEWLEWEGYAPFWTRVARVIGRSLSSGPLELAARVEGSRVRLVLEAVSPEGDPLDGIDARVMLYRRDSGEEPSEIALKQIGPGRYEGQAPVVVGASYVALARARQTSIGEGGEPVERTLPPALAVAVSPPGVEFTPGEDPMPLLARIVEVSGGVMRSEASLSTREVFDRSTLVPRRVLRPLWRDLLPWIMAVLLMDIATRRIAWDRLVSDRFGDGLGSRARDATRHRGSESASTLGALRASRPVIGREQSGTLSDADAQRIRQQQASDRLASRIADARARIAAPSRGVGQGSEPGTPGAGTSTPPRSEPDRAPSESGESSLMAAKRRARERMERDGRSEG